MFSLSLMESAWVSAHSSAITSSRLGASWSLGTITDMMSMPVGMCSTRMPWRASTCSTRMAKPTVSFI